jgi:Uma2 family endonuclease
VPVRLARYDTDEASARRAGPERKTMAITPGTMTLDEFLARYEHDPVLEYERGVVTEKMVPVFQHGVLQLVICQWIHAFAYPRQLAFAVPELRTINRHAEVSRIPDVAVYVWDRIDPDPKARQHASVIPPDIAIEIASPGQSRRKQIERCEWFATHGSRIALMVDPRTETIVDVRPDRDERRLRGGDVVDLSDVTPGLATSFVEVFTTCRVG